MKWLSAFFLEPSLLQANKINEHFLESGGLRLNFLGFGFLLVLSQYE